MSIPGIEKDVCGRFPDFLRDESRKTGYAETISFPSNEADLIEILKANKGPVTVQGARTGITGGAVPAGGHIINLSKMTAAPEVHIPKGDDASSYMTVLTGLSLTDARDGLEQANIERSSRSDDTITPLFFPPDPTEDTASIGGMIACNASGARSFKYGPTRSYVRRLKIITVNGDLIELTRGAEKAEALTFNIRGKYSNYSGVIPSYALPSVKNASGYFSRPDMDLIDLFIGSEGTLGITCEADLLLTPLPQVNWAIMAFLPDADSSVAFVHACRMLKGRSSISAIEYFDSNALSLLRSQKRTNPAFEYLPEIDEDWNNCIYVELDGMLESETEETAIALSSLIEKNGGSESATWMATESREMERMKKFRHALPEAVNLMIDNYRRETPEITKLGTDFAVPDNCLGDLISLYNRDLKQAGLQYVIFGHIGNNHLHVNILPESMDEYSAGKELYLKWAKSVIAMNGTVSAEHGIGKLKTELLACMYGTTGIEEMRKLKKIFDPDCRLNPGNLFPVTP